MANPSHGSKTGDAQIRIVGVVRIKGDARGLRRRTIERKVAGHVVPRGVAIEVGLRGVEELEGCRVALFRECPCYGVVGGRKPEILERTSATCAPAGEILRTVPCDGSRLKIDDQYEVATQKHPLRDCRITGQRRIERESNR